MTTAQIEELTPEQLWENPRVKLMVQTMVKYQQAVDRINNHNGATRVAVQQHVGLWHPHFENWVEFKHLYELESTGIKI